VLILLPVYLLQVGPDWEQVINKISRGHCLPLLLVYADHDDLPSAESKELLTRISVKDIEPSNTGREQSKFSANKRGMQKCDTQVISEFLRVNIRQYNVLDGRGGIMV